MRRSHKVFWPENRLKKLVSLPGGIPRSEAIAGAERRVEALRDSCFSSMEEKVRTLEEILGTGLEHRLDAESLRSMARASDGLVTLSATFGQAHLNAMAKGLCDLVLAALAGRNADRQALDVHVQAMRALLCGRAPVPAEAAARLTAELAKVREKFADGGSPDAVGAGGEGASSAQGTDSSPAPAPTET